MKHLLFTLLAAVLLICTKATTTFAQTEALVISSTTLDQKARATTSKMYLKDNILVAEEQEKKDKTTVMFDADKEMLYIIDHKKKEYIEMTRQDMEALNEMLQQQLAAMEQQLAMLPENQRKMIQEQMGAAFGGKQQTAEYSLEESGVSVKEWKADKYVGMTEGQKQSEIYVASYNELGQDPENFQSLEKFFETIKNYIQGMSKSFSGAGISFFSESMPGYKTGVPVKTVLYNSKGEVISTTMIDSLTEETVEENLFQLPQDYKKKKMDELTKN